MRTSEALFFSPSHVPISPSTPLQSFAAHSAESPLPKPTLVCLSLNRLFLQQCERVSMADNLMHRPQKPRQESLVRIDCYSAGLDLTSSPQEAAMTPSDNISFMKRWYDEVWRGKSDETIRELLAPDARLWGQVGPDQEIRGPEGFLEFARRIRDAFPDTKLVVQDCFAVEDKVAVRWTAIGTHKGDALGVAPTGKTV